MIELTKAEAIKQIDLRKKTLIDLTKDTPLENLTSRVALVLDFSGSMSSLYDNGSMDRVIQRILPLAMKFDDNGELDFWIFDDEYRRLDGVTLENFWGIAKDLRNKYDMGMTSYAPVMRDIKRMYIDENPENIPSYVIFITDGDNQDKRDARDTITDLSYYPVFFQFIGIGNSNFDFLEELDEMEGRFVDNANFFQVNDLDNLSDDELYKKLLQEYPQWLGYSEVKTMLSDVKALSRRSSSVTPNNLGVDLPKKGAFRRFLSELFEAALDLLD